MIIYHSNKFSWLGIVSVSANTWFLSLIKQYSYESGATNVNVNLSNLVNDTYTVNTFDNVLWDSQQLIILK